MSQARKYFGTDGIRGPHLTIALLIDSNGHQQPLGTNTPAFAHLEIDGIRHEKGIFFV